MEFEYFKQTVVNGNLDVDDIGNCAILATNDEGAQYVLVIDTSLGITRVFNYGPIIPDLDMLPKSVMCSFKRIQFSHTKIVKIIDEFLNNSFAHITTAIVVDKAEALETCRSIIDYMKQDNFY